MKVKSRDQKWPLKLPALGWALFFPTKCCIKAIEHQNLFSNKVIGLLPKTSFRHRIERREK